MFFSPTLLLKDNNLAISLLRVIGSGALALGTLSFLMLGLSKPKELKPGLITLCSFHFLVAISQVINLSNIISIVVFLVHSLFAVLFISILWNHHQIEQK
jgi:hypothetical protein